MKISQNFVAFIIVLCLSLRELIPSTILRHDIIFDFILFSFRNKSVYILTSVLEPPFLMEKQKGGQPQQQTQSYGNDRFEGKDTK